MNITTESEKNASAPEGPQPKTRREPYVPATGLNVGVARVALTT
jgi:hypothetical protein